MSIFATLPPVIEAFYRHLARTHPEDDLRLIETHISWVILAGAFAYKIKKPVDFGFLDFSSLEKRRFYCQEELRLNRRLAPELYLGMMGLIDDSEHPVVEDGAAAAEYAVKLRRFAEGTLASELVAHGRLTPELLDELADTLAAFHGNAACASALDSHGHPERVAEAQAQNFPAVRAVLGDGASQALLDSIKAWSEARFQTLYPHLAARKREGHVRECHGDLHLGNLVLFAGRLIPFDCIEFSEDLRFIDTLSELAFLVMDLEVRGMQEAGWRLLNRYLSLTGDYAGMRVFDYYRVYRAMVRAKIACLSWQQADGEQRPHWEHQARAYLQYASAIIHKPTPLLILTHGFSGSGKSHLAARLAPALPALHLRSDIERKRLAGQHPTATRYSPSMTEATYERLSSCATAILEGGDSVIVDATFLKARQRQRFRALAEEKAVPFVILDLKAPAALLASRIQARRQAGNDPSEATLEVLATQQAEAEPLCAEEMGDRIAIDTRGEPSLAELLTALRPRRRSEA